MLRPGGSGFLAPFVKALENKKSSRIALRLNSYMTFSTHLTAAAQHRDALKQNLADRMDASKQKTQPKLYWFHWRVEQMRLGMNARREISEAHYRRYQRAGKKDKGKILDEVAGTTGLNRNHPAHVLTSYGKKQAVKGEARLSRKKREQGKRGGGPPMYHHAFVALLARIREDHGWGPVANCCLR
jgi:hypothetical protein